MSDDKTVVLLKAAKELNIGLATAVEFLGKKGYAVDNKPNTKLSGEMYNVLLREFQGDKIVKEEANQIVIGKIRRDEPEVTTEKAPEPTKKTQDFESDGVLIKNLHSYVPPVEKPKEEKPAEPVAEAPKPVESKPAENADESALPGVKVVGKINLNDLNPKTRPAKTEAVKKEEAPVAPPVVKEEKPVEAVAPVAPKVEEQPVAKPAEPVKVEEKPAPVVAEKPAETKPEPTPAKPVEAPKDEVIKARSVKLTGPNIIGKIVLPTTPDRRNQPVASSSSDSEAARRKRKRKKTPGAPGTTPQQGAPGTPGTNPQGGPRTPYQGNRPGGGQGGGYQGNRNNNNSRPGYQGNRNSPASNTPKEEPTEKEIQDQIKATLARLSGAGKSGKFAQRAKLRRQKRDDVALSAEEAA
ncbi:MAG: translation initiation factor IF-2, partial [Pedobacter sp.]